MKYVSNNAYSNVVYLKGMDVFESSGDVLLAVNCITLTGAVKYCEWKSSISGIRFRLPTEAEWELANKYEVLAGNAKESIVGSWCRDYYSTALDMQDCIDPSGPSESSMKRSDGTMMRVVRRFTTRHDIRYPGAESFTQGAVWGLRVLVEN